MTRHMMQQDMVRSDMGKLQAASYNYAGNSSCYWCSATRFLRNSDRIIEKK